MAVDTPSFFAQVIQDHLDLKRRNADLEPKMPLQRYMAEDPFTNHPLFKTEEQARLEETMDGEEPAAVATEEAPRWAAEDTVEHASPEAEEESLWSRSREFDWGD